MKAVVTEKQAQAAVDAALAELDARLTAVAESIRAHRVIPLYRKLGATYSAGMGTFAFFKDGRAIDEASRKDLRSLYRVLMQTTCNLYLGDYVRDVDEPML